MENRAIRLYRFALYLLVGVLLATAAALGQVRRDLRQARKENQRLTREQAILRADDTALRRDRDRLQGSAVMWSMAYNEHFCGTARVSAEFIARKRFPLTNADYMAVGKRINEGQLPAEAPLDSDRRYLPSGIALLNEGLEGLKVKGRD